MALRSHVSRIAARGTAAPEENPSALDNLRPEIPAEEPEVEAAEGPEVMREIPVGRGRVAAPAAEAPVKAKRQGRPPGSGKKALQATPALTGTESVPELRAKIKEVEQQIKDSRTRHDEEMKTLKSVYADLHARMFDHVK
jgi:hypothetical protein